jgi:hypothetical protein
MAQDKGLREAREAFEKDLMQRAFAKNWGNMSRTAADLGGESPDAARPGGQICRRALERGFRSGEGRPSRPQPKAACGGLGCSPWHAALPRAGAPRCLHPHRATASAPASWPPCAVARSPIAAHAVAPGGYSCTRGPQLMRRMTLAGCLLGLRPIAVSGCAAL